jgi:hypothetical protein
MDRVIGGTDSTRIPVKMGKPVQEMNFARVVRYRTYATKSGLLLMGPSDVLLAMETMRRSSFPPYLPDPNLQHICVLLDLSRLALLCGRSGLPLLPSLPAAFHFQPRTLIMGSVPFPFVGLFRCHHYCGK